MALVCAGAVKNLPGVEDDGPWLWVSDWFQNIGVGVCWVL